MNLGSDAQVKQIAAGSSMSEVLLNDGTVWSAGRGLEGEMGNGLYAATNTAPTKASISNVVSIAAGQYSAYAVRNDGSVWSWGWNAYGQLGNNSSVDKSPTPVQVTGLSSVIQVTAENDTGVALRSDGTVWTWGQDADGDLGNNTECTPSSGCEGSTVPVQVHGPGNAGYLTGIVAIASGQNYTLALQSDGTVWGWGADNYGQLGDNSRVAKMVPVEMLSPAGTAPLTNVVSIAAGGTHSLMLLSNGTVLAVGYDDAGQLGDNSAGGADQLPVSVVGLSGVTEISAGFDHSMAVRNDGSVWAWGNNTSGQLGIGVSGGERDMPVQITALNHVSAVTAGNGISLAIG
jgi:alpha-tubulin suppressor-like RCC1 family protein